MTTANFTAPAAATFGTLGSVGQWIAVLMLGIVIGYAASEAPRTPVQGLTPAVDGAASLQVEDWHGNVRRSSATRQQ